MYTSDFVTSRWLSSPHLQTLGAAAPLFAPPRSHVETTTDDLRIPLDPERKHVLHARAWWATTTERRPVVVVIHGIGGSTESRYVLRASVALHRRGYHVVRLNLRGAGTSIPDVPSLYHAGLTSDVGVVVRELLADPRADGVSILGFSGGGSIALKLAGEWGTDVPSGVRSIVSISAPLDYTKVGPWMDSIGRLPYRFHVLRGLSEGARAFARHHPMLAHYRPADVKRMSSFRYYDGTIIAPMHGFANVDAYYEAARSGPWLPRIEVPTLLLHAEDDPMVPSFSVKPWLADASRAVRVAMSTQGGHIGWVSGLDEASWITSWATSRALTFLDATTTRAS
ncbi:Hydrolase, alpha/beta fold family functionally coupled to Phosphoribulokinase [Labilithrix luteola]|uniref:Hydrolase, alpha/beta fold family functionally coupled to Phosphoribulokinase n=1 Tax=Labilithrix luteola TaxID=1391654 RepID=A0A0K1Q7R7_9BACT|nr:alpha/beta fold hydrolase [Labilithrix luteola]AKV01861.1 Hydrolase, alpha/beta fold family functionally coupled to Phosphoribulokinase [Labilithrix luteola]